jgi:hypothetical protein
MRPCEVAGEMVSTHPYENYAQKVSDIPSCFDKSGQFDLKLSDCRLEKP